MSAEKLKTEIPDEVIENLAGRILPSILKRLRNIILGELNFRFF